MNFERRTCASRSSSIQVLALVAKRGEAREGTRILTQSGESAKSSVDAPEYLRDSRGGVQTPL